MTNNELFINATRANYQFPFRGMINVIDLWDLSLTNLDSVFKTLNAEVKKSEEESLLNTKSKEDEELYNKIEIVKYIVGVKLDEKKKREDAKKNAEMRQRLLEIKAKRQDAKLENMSDEDLDKALAELGEQLLQIYHIQYEKQTIYTIYGIYFYIRKKRTFLEEFWRLRQ